MDRASVTTTQEASAQSPETETDPGLHSSTFHVPTLSNTKGQSAARLLLTDRPVRSSMMASKKSGTARNGVVLTVSWI